MITISDLLIFKILSTSQKLNEYGVSKHIKSNTTQNMQPFKQSLNIMLCVHLYQTEYVSFELWNWFFVCS